MSVSWVVAGARPNWKTTAGPMRLGPYPSSTRRSRCSAARSRNRGHERRASQGGTMADHTFTPGPTPNTVRAADGTVLTVPDGWVLLPPGDAALTRRVKEAGDHWAVQEKRGRKVFSRGVWAPAATIDRIRAELAAERATERYTKRKEADAQRRDKAQAEYV